MADFNVFGSQDGDDFEVSGSGYDYLLSCDPVTFTVGQPNTAASFLFTRRLAADSGTFALTGFDVDLSAFGAYRIVCDQAAFVLTGTDASFTFTRVLAADSGSFSLTGQNSTILSVYLLSATPGAFTLNGTTTRLKVSRKLVAESGTFTLSGTSSTLQKHLTLVADPGEFSLAGTSVQIDYSAYSEWVVQSKSTATWAAA